MTQDTTCPQCSSAYAYEDRNIWVCPNCGHEWQLMGLSEAEDDTAIRDAHGAILADGDTVTVIKDLKIKGSSSVVKIGTKAKNIRLLYDANDGHNIACKLDSFGAMDLKSEFVKKS